MNTTEDVPATSDSRLPVMIQQGKLLKVKVPVTGVAVKAVRGGVSEFSAKSRKRMLETMACLDNDRLRAVVFVTLTYPDDAPPFAEQTSVHLKNFLKRLKRRFPEASAIWRREWEDRKSGDHVGQMYPHFHFLFFNLPFVHHAEVNAHWREVLGYTGYLRTEIKMVRSWRQAFSYVAKYMAKTPQPPEAAVGDARSGERRRRPQAAPEAGGCSLVYIPYRAAEEEQEQDTATPAFVPTGRHWGVFNRSFLPLAKRRTKRISFADAELLKEEATQIWDGVNQDATLGFTLFSNDAVGLYDWMLLREQERELDAEDDE